MSRSMTKRPRHALDWMQSMARLIGVMAICSSSALAADCDLRVSQAVVDYGALYRGELSTKGASDLIPLGTRVMMVTATCQKPTPFGLQLEGEPTSKQGFRFGSGGRYTAKLSHATVDGQAVLLKADKEAAVGAPTPSAFLEPNLTIVAQKQSTVAIGRVFSAQVEIATYVDDATTRVRDRTQLEGHGSFRLVLP